MRILSLDVSASSTGWAFTQDGVSFSYGTIVTKPKYTRAERLVTFSEKLEELINKHIPEVIVMEDTFSGINVNTLKMLSEFAGVAKYTCKKTLDLEPLIVSNSSVKSFFKAAKKEDLFYFVQEVLEIKDLTFKKHNDIIDALAQLLYFSQSISKIFVFRLDEDYGYLFTNTTKTN